MKIIVLHGDNSSKSYERLMKFIESAKTRNWEIVYDDLGVSQSLFGNEKLIIIRDVRLITKKALESLAKIEGTLILYSDKDLAATTLKLLPKDTKIEKFDLPKLLFTFLESIYPKNSKRCIELLQKVTENEPIELVFFFIARHLRDLYWVLTDPASTGFPSWKISKLTSQANKFSINNLQLIIEKLAEMDIKVKSSKSNLARELDLMLIKQLE